MSPYVAVLSRLQNRNILRGDVEFISSARASYKGFSQATMRHIIARNRGMTVISILTIAAALTVVIAFSGISITHDPAATEMKLAVQSLERSLQAARRAARIYQTRVDLHLPSADDKLNAISYSVPLAQKSSVLLEFESTGFLLPAGVRVESNQDVIKFNSNGEVEPPAQLLLISSTDENYRERILVK